VIYRFFGPDPMRFESSLVLRCGSRGDDTETVVYYYLAEGSRAPEVRSPNTWQLTGTFPSPNYEAFLQAEVPEQQAGPWPEKLILGDKEFPVYTLESKHTWIEMWPYFHVDRRRGGGAPEALVDRSVYARTTIDSDRDKQVNLRLGFDDWVTVWVNAEKIKTIRHDKGKIEVATVSVNLRKGANEMLVKSNNLGAFTKNFRTWAFSCVISDAN